jgi:hypothetical protein
MEKRAELDQHECSMSAERGRLAVALDLLTDALILVGQHGPYCVSNRNPATPALDPEAALKEIEGAKALMQSVMEEMRKEALPLGSRGLNSGWCARRDSNSRPNAPEAFALSS